MKRLVLLMITIVLIKVVYAQSNKTFSGSYSGRNTNGQAVYEYYEKNYEKIYNGSFQYSFIKNKIKFSIVGNFSDNKRTGIWKIKGELLEPIGDFIYADYLMEGNYINGELAGKWTYKQTFKQKYTGGVATVSSYAFANFKNNHFVDDIYVLFKNDNVLTVELKGQFDINGYMNDLWSIKYPKNTSSFEAAKNSPIIEDLRQYKNGLCLNMKILNSTSGEIIENNDNSEFLNTFFKHLDLSTNICSYGKKVYSLDENNTGKIIYGIAKTNSHINDALNVWTSNSTENLLNEISQGFINPNLKVEKQVVDLGGPDLMYQKATNFIQSGNANDAFKYINYAINSDPTNLEYLHANGWWQLLEKQYENSLTTFIKANNLLTAPLKEVNLYIKCRLAHAYILNNQYEKALKIYTENVELKIGEKEWIAVVNKDFEIMNQNGISHPDFDKIKNELRQKQEVKEKENQFKKIVSNGDELFKQKKYGKAKKEYKQALQIKPDDNYAQEQKKKSGKKAVGKTVLTIVLLPFYIIGWVLF